MPCIAALALALFSLLGMVPIVALCRAAAWGDAHAPADGPRARSDERETA